MLGHSFAHLLEELFARTGAVSAGFALGLRGSVFAMLGHSFTHSLDELFA